MQPCCFEDKRNNRKYGLMRLINNNKLKKIPKGRTKSSNKQNNKNNNNSNIQLTETKNEYNIITNKETSKKKIPNKNRNKYDEKKDIYTVDKIKKSRKGEIPISNHIRNNTCDSKKIKNNKNVEKKYFMKGELIGEGRFGKIYSGLLYNGEIISIKIFKNLSDLQKKRIINNLETVYKLNHKNIIKAIQIDNENIINENGDLSIVYESIKLNNVQEIIEKYGSLDEKIIQQYIKQLLEGLKYLHEQKIFHKNLKPSNIIVDIDGTIKISDCLIDNLILGDEENIYNTLIKSDKIEYYIPPFFIKEINNYIAKDSVNNCSTEINQNKVKNSFDDWQSYDLWHLGCLIIEVFSKKKPWSHYNFNNNSEFFEFLRTTKLIPDIPKKLSLQCNELIKLLFNYSLTKNPNIYDIILNLDFFQMNANDFTYNYNNKISDLRFSLNDSQGIASRYDESNSIMSNNNVLTESGKQLGKFLEQNKVVNIFNSNNNASFSVSYTVDDNNLSLSQSNTYNILNQSINNKLNQSTVSKGKNINNINIKKIKIIMPEVEEAQIEQSPDIVKNEYEKNFNFSKQ